MKILISDYPDELKRDIAYEKELLTRGFADAGVAEQIEIAVLPYENETQFVAALRDTDVLLTAFLPLGEKVLCQAPKLKCIAVNATGYGTVDIAAADRLGIGVCPVKEYCTREVAEHTMSLMLALTRQLKHYTKEIEQEKKWIYRSAPDMFRLSGQTLAIFGFGRIGQAVCRRAQAFEMNVIAVDPYLPKEIAAQYGATLVSKEQALSEADIITNHMNQTAENRAYFSEAEFAAMKKRPIFLNVARGESVDETALLAALDSGKVRAAGLDVLAVENPNLDDCPFAGRENVLLTPHAAFYSKTSMRELQRISCENIVYYMTGQSEKVFHLVNQPKRRA